MKVKFDPKLVKAISNNLFVQVFVEEVTSISGPGGTTVQVQTGETSPEFYAHVHSVGPQIKDIKVDDLVLLKPLKAGYSIIEGNKYCFIQEYHIEAVIPESYKEFFASKKQVQPKVKQELIN